MVAHDYGIVGVNMETTPVEPEEPEEELQEEQPEPVPHIGGEPDFPT